MRLGQSALQLFAQMRVLAMRGFLGPAAKALPESAQLAGFRSAINGDPRRIGRGRRSVAQDKRRALKARNKRRARR